MAAGRRCCSGLPGIYFGLLFAPLHAARAPASALAWVSDNENSPDAWTGLLGVLGREALDDRVGDQKRLQHQSF